MSLHGSRSGVESLGDPIPLHRGKEAEWKARMEVKLGARLLLDLVNGIESRPDFLKEAVFEDPVNGTPVKNLAIDFEAIQSSTPMRTEKGRQQFINSRTDRAQLWKDRHDRAFFFIKESLMMTDYGIAKAIEMDNFRDNVSEAWKQLVGSFSIGNSKWRCVLLRIEHYRNFSIKEDEDFEQYLGRVILATNHFKEANRGQSLSDQELLAYLLVGIGKNIFQEVSQDLGRFTEDQLTFEAAIICIRNRLLMQKVNSTVNDRLSDSDHFTTLEKPDINLLHRTTSDFQRARDKAVKRKSNLRKKAFFKLNQRNFLTNKSTNNMKWLMCQKIHLKSVLGSPRNLEYYQKL